MTQFWVGAPMFGIGWRRSSGWAPKFRVGAPKFRVGAPKFRVGVPKFRVGAPKFGILFLRSFG